MTVENGASCIQKIANTAVSNVVILVENVGYVVILQPEQENNLHHLPAMRKKRSFLHQCLFDNSEQVANGKGKNLIPPPEREPLWKAYMEKFKDPLIMVLLVVFCFSIVVALYEAFYMGQGTKILLEPLGILSALLLATGVGFIFEVKAEREFEVLNTVKDRRPIKVYRRFMEDGKEKIRIREVRKHDVCVGDYVYLENGDEIPADGRLDETNAFIVDESNFTGEPYARKSAYEAEFEQEATFPPNMVLRGSTVIGGTAIYHVEQIGMDTVEGKGVAKTQEGSEVETPLNQQLDSLGRTISKLSFIIAALIVVGRMVYFFFFDGNAANNHSWLEIAEFALGSVMLAVTLVVVAVPEGLPMSVTVSLALSMRRMLKEKNLVRKLHACETMGATTVICTDKTGTLTQNKMTVVEHDFYGEEAAKRIQRNIAINSTAEISLDDSGKEKPLGNPTEGALLAWQKTLGVNYEELRHLYEIGHGEPFSTEKKYMKMEFEAKAGAALPREERHVRYVKGAPEIVLDMCEAIAGGAEKAHVLSRLAEYQSKAMRTLAFASQHEADGTWSPLTFDGIVGIADPVREDVREAIADCTQKAGVRVIIVTGDTQGTANEIGRQIGLLKRDEQQQTMTGDAFEKLSDEEALRLIARPDFKLISRARPDDKARLVTLLQRQGQVVAVTGDGTNDAPALSKAQVGLSMGDGTSRAKEASDITIIDNSFSSIVRAIIWGRSLYQNIQRFILFQMTINICACLIVLIGAFTGLDSPLNVTQMLWVNLIMDTFAAMALSSLPANKHVLYDKPRDPNSHIVNRRMAAQTVGVGVLFFLILLGMWQLLWHCDISAVSELLCTEKLKLFATGIFDLSKSKPHLSLYERSVFFTFFVLMQFWNLFNAKYFKTSRSLLQDICGALRRDAEVKTSFSVSFIGIALVILVGQVIIVSFGQEMFGVSPLSAADWGCLLLLTSPVLILADIVRWIRNL